MLYDSERSPREMLNDLRETLHLWTARIDDDMDPDWAAVHEQTLSVRERERYHRYHRDQDRQLFLVAHVMVRQVLSSYVDRQPDWWEFKTNRHGRPEISNRDSPPGLRFNLSHTRGYVAIVVHDDIDAGVDVERTDRIRNPRGLAERVFAEPEHAELMALEPDALDERFYELWTMKEAFIKAKGMGLAIPLDRFWFEADPDGGFTLKSEEPVERHPDFWYFTLRKPTPVHVVATACRSGSSARPVALRDLTVDLRE